MGGGAIDGRRLHGQRGSTRDCSGEGAREELRPRGWDEELVEDQVLPFIG